MSLNVARSKDSLLAIVFPPGARIRYNKKETQDAFDEFADLYAAYTNYTKFTDPAILNPVLDALCENEYVKSRVGQDKSKEWIRNLFLSHI